MYFKSNLNLHVILFFQITLLLHCLDLNAEKLSKVGLVHCVDPFIGTGGHGHTFPSACLPFAMVQLSPDNGRSDWDWCSGYHASDSILIGFSHTHLSGTGCSDMRDILLMPTTSVVTSDSTKKGYNFIYNYQSKYSHANEKASPGYYQVALERILNLRG